jgi:hypothetical protein
MGYGGKPCKTAASSMKIICEVSKPHYHPGPDFTMEVTKKRDLSVPPHWVTNERIEKDGQSFAIVMPPRDKELYEIRQPVHIHFPKEYEGQLKEYELIKVGDYEITAKVKIEPYLGFVPKVHFDHISAEQYNIKSGETEAELV